MDRSQRRRSLIGEPALHTLTPAAESQSRLMLQHWWIETNKGNRAQSVSTEVFVDRGWRKSFEPYATGNFSLGLQSVRNSEHEWHVHSAFQQLQGEIFVALEVKEYNESASFKITLRPGCESKTQFSMLYRLDSRHFVRPPEPLQRRPVDHVQCCVWLEGLFPNHCRHCRL